MNNNLAAPPEGRGNLRGFYSYKNTFDKDSVWLDIPKHGSIVRTLPAGAGADRRAVVFVDNSDPYADDLETSLAESSAEALVQSRNNRWGSGSRTSDAGSHGLDSVSTVTSHDRFPYSPMDYPVSDGVSYPSPNQSRSSAMPPPTSPSISLSSSNNTNINFLLNPSHSHSLSPTVDHPVVTPDQRSTSLPSRPSASQSFVENQMENRAETDFEVAFLLRHYAEGPGLWYVSWIPS